jgi:hypothetical protein
MTSALKLAKECGIRDNIHDDAAMDYISNARIETFYRRAQAQALRKAARMWSIFGTITTDYGSTSTEVCRADNIIRAAEELENQK